MVSDYKKEHFTMDALSFLQRCDYFKGLSDRNKKALASICSSRTLQKRDYLFFEGQKGDAIYLLSEGSIQLVKTSPEGKEVVIKTIASGETFAEVILFEQHSYPVTAIAVRKSKVYKIPRRDFLRLFDDSAFRNDFITFLMRRMRYLANRILYLTAYDVEERFFRFLEDQYGRKEQYSIPLSKKDIAADIGATPETLSRLILRLDEEGKLSWKGNIVRLVPGYWENIPHE